MNYKRAVLFGIFVYLSAFVVIGTLRILFNGLLTANFTLPNVVFPIIWVLFIPIILLLSKWYFKEVEPTVKRGFLLGLVSVGVTLSIDLIGYSSLRLAGQDTAVYAGLYGNWRFWITFGLVIVLCTFAGWEFDGTHSKPSKEKS